MTESEMELNARKPDQNGLRWVAFVFMIAMTIACVYVMGLVVAPRQQGPGNDQQNSNLFYSLNKQGVEIDVLILGSSQTYAGIQPICLYEQYGITAFNWGNSVQSPIVTYAKLQDALSEHNIKAIVLAATQLFKEYNVDNTAVEPFLRRAVDSLRWNRYKFEAVARIVKKSEKQTALSYVFPFFRYHSRFLEINRSSFDFSYFRDPNPSTTLGAYAKKTISEGDYPENWMKQTDKKSALSEASVEMFDKIVQLCKERGVRVFLVRPASRRGWSTAYSNAASDYAASRGIDYLDFNLPSLTQETGIDPYTDFYDDNHLNVGGAWKTSLFFGQYLRQLVDLEDHRPKRIAFWEEALSDFHEKYDDFIYFFEEKISHMEYMEYEEPELIYRNDSDYFIDAKESNYNYTTIFTGFRSLATYEFTVTGCDMPLSDEKVFSVTLYNHVTKQIAGSFEFDATDCADQVYEFTTGLNADQLSLLLYAGKRGETSGVSIQVSQMQVAETGEYISLPDTD